LGTEKARFILRLYYNDRDFDSFEMFSELSKQLGESQ
jgi:hypothetical protein